MSLNAKIRHLVMNRTNQAIAPRDELLDGFDPADLKARGEIPKKYSPSFVNEGTARVCRCSRCKVPWRAFLRRQGCRWLHQV